MRVATITKHYCNIPFKDYDPPQSPCSLSPCGINAVCNERNGAGSCACVPEFFGDPYVECRPECVTNSDCPKSRSCVNNKCRDPCSSGTCGINAECRVFSHSPTCSCLEGYTGNPSSSCHIIPEIRKPYMQFSIFLLHSITSIVNFIHLARDEPITDVCSPSPCGPYSTCRTFNQHAVCSCALSYIGAPPNCRPECVVSSDCPQNRACNNAKCIDPCPGTCGHNAKCQVVGHNPICSCEANFVGDPFVRCIQEERKTNAYFIVDHIC